MVRIFIISLFFFWSGVLVGQRINASFNGGWMAGKTNSTVFDDSPFQFLFAAPYATTSSSAFDFVSPYDQVRLVQIYGATPYTRNNFSFGGGLQYQALNNWRFGVQIGAFRDQDDVYYGFQNMVINASESETFTDTQSPELLDEFISISRWMNTYELNGIYEFNIKSIIKPEVTFGYLYKLQIFSTYSSKLVENQDTYLDSEDNDELKEYFNAKVFQYKLYQELSRDGFSHYVKLGIGAKIYSGHLQLEWLRSLGKSSGEYYRSQNIFNLKFTYDLVSIPLFK